MNNSQYCRSNHFQRNSLWCSHQCRAKGCCFVPLDLSPSPRFYSCGLLCRSLAFLPHPHYYPTQIARCLSKLSQIQWGGQNSVYRHNFRNGVGKLSVLECRDYGLTNYQIKS
ncbi:hypothetical protein M378DRAFT_739165 [Amanita muscaria Koide BX008]|uniref:Uncharacterized protein n=1 Tax=Amanita muscaria (strain Koide BX008) TaxID=946122 RepID=A0A0C2T8D5_AMAMK|nr:hypothetical protein M378DRAFT_739165 [Amanita muscaria Koide BX008]